jgi:8-oxo-dGTP pyrophosphatase MutT (NUDIX family)
MKAEPSELNQTQRHRDPRAAVGIIVCSLPVESVLLVKRNVQRDDPWSGHYAFPGGRREERDATIYHTCIREVKEETGIGLEPGSLHQTCEPALAGRNVKAPILVQPYVFRMRERPPVIIEEREISRYTWLSTAALKNRARHQVIEVRSAMVKPVFPMDDYFIWGFTYSLLCRLLGFDQRLLHQ